MIEAIFRGLRDVSYNGSVAPAEDASPAMASIISRVLRRDRNTCQCCGYSAMRYLEIQSYDGSDLVHEDNLVTLCHFCRALWHVPLAVANGAVFLVEPRYSQIDIVRLSRAYRWLPNWTHAIPEWESDAAQKAKNLLAQSDIQYEELPDTIQMIWDNPSMPADKTIRKIMRETGLRLFFGEAYKPKRIDSLRAFLTRHSVESNPFPNFCGEQE